MLVYLAYGLLVMHVALGLLQKEPSVIYAIGLSAGAILVGGVHLVAGMRELRSDRPGGSVERDPDADATWVDACAVSEIPQDRAKVICLAGADHGRPERVAVFRHGDRLSAVTNVCRHQAGPLGEGRVIDGCITCPWHGWQYRPEDGQSPPPFDEKIATYEVRLRGERVQVNAQANAPGAATEGASVGGMEPARDDDDGLYVGYLPVPASRMRFLKLVVPLLLIMIPGLAAGFAAVQSNPGTGVWEYGASYTAEGALRLTPYPMLFTEDDEGNVRTILLVGSGKSGPPGIDGRADGDRVRVTGAPITRAGARILEVTDASSVELLAPATAADITTVVGGDSSTGWLEGEIIDPKCYFGAMKPAFGRTHRACAILCIKGGIPPMFVHMQPDGVQRYFLLADGEGNAATEVVLPFVGEPVRVRGPIEILPDTEVLRLTHPIERVEIDG